MPGFIGKPGGEPSSPLNLGFKVPTLPGIGAPYLDIGTLITSRTTLTYLEAGPYYDIVTVPSITSIPFGELEFLHPTGQWGPFDTDDGQL